MHDVAYKKLKLPTFPIRKFLCLKYSHYRLFVEIVAFRLLCTNSKDFLTYNVHFFYLYNFNANV